MKIDITEKEYRALLDILYIADWVLHAHKIKDDPRTEIYKNFGQKIFSYAKKAGYEDLIEYAPDHNAYFPTREYEETGPAMEFIEEFENDTFWDELIDRLAQRDLIKQVDGLENLSKMSFEDRVNKTMPFEEKYAVEFETNDLDNLKIT